MCSSFIDIRSYFSVQPILAQLRKVEASVEKPRSSFGNRSPTEGPWPECVGQTGEWCTDYIANWIGYGASLHPGGREKQVVQIITPYEYVENRVWIHADDEGKVISTPERG